MTPPKTLPHSPYLPFDPTVSQYNTAFGHLLPWEFNGWKRESLSWKEGCYLHAGLNPAGPHRLTGPDALQLLKDACMNGFGRFSIGASKHGVMCNAQGNVMSDGIVWRLGEEEFVSFFLTPYLDFLVDSGRYRVKGENLSGKVFLFQVAGPRSLEVLEAATGESLRDLKFLWHRPSRIRRAGRGHRDIDVRIYRLGVARTLAYEVHGQLKDAQAVYQALLTAGEGLADEFGRILTDANARSVKILQDKGTPVLKISDEDRARLSEAGKKYIGEWIQRADGAGLDGQALVDRYTALIAEFAQQRDEQGYPWAAKAN